VRAVNITTFKARKTEAFLFIICGVQILSATGCGSDHKRLKEPTERATLAAQGFLQTHPQARVYFSQNTGETMWIDGRAKALSPTPSDLTYWSMKKTVLAFLKANPQLFPLINPEDELLAYSNGTKGLTMRLEQTRSGVPIPGAYLIAFFDLNGSLVQITGHTVPSAEIGKSAVPLYDASKIAHSNLIWHRLEDGNERVVEEAIETDLTGPWRVWRDPKTHEVLEKRSELLNAQVTAPTYWKYTGEYTHVEAPDRKGYGKAIPCTRIANKLVFGFAPPAFFSLGNAAMFFNAGGNTTYDPIVFATDQSEWIKEPLYAKNFSDATMLARNVEATLKWFEREMELRSFDGKGGSIFSAIQYQNPDWDSSKPNAWGGGGVIYIGSGRSGTGQTYGEAIEIVAHEFAHSVTSSFTLLEIVGEAGALHESLADLFGSAVEGFHTGVMGLGAGKPHRNVIHPHNYGDPDKYSEYIDEPIDKDHDWGNVHANAGITSRAISSLIFGEDGGGPAYSPEAVMRLIVDSFREVAYSGKMNLEQFSATLSAYCRQNERAVRLRADQENLCNRLEGSFHKTELLGNPLTTH